MNVNKKIHCKNTKVKLLWKEANTSLFRQR